MISKDLLEILACPETKTPLRVADGKLLDDLNGRIAQGTLSNRDGAKVTEPFEEGLVREDGQVFYPVRGDIPVLLIGEGISLVEETAS